MKQLFVAISVCIAVSAPAPALAGQYTLTIHKTGHLAKLTDISAVKVVGATPETIPVPGKEGLTFTVEVTMPEGLCQTRVGIIYAWRRVDTYANICSNAAVTAQFGNILSK